MLAIILWKNETVKEGGLRAMVQGEEKNFRTNLIANGADYTLIANA
jgi:hypothetical protein